MTKAKKAKRVAHKRVLTERFLKRVRPGATASLVWDMQQRGLALRIEPTGHKAWKCIYTQRGRPRWYHIGNANAIDLAAARKLAGRIMFAVAEGKDPQAERQANRSEGTFEELSARYVEYAKKRNRSWRQYDGLVRKHLLPRWGKLHATTITRSDVKAAFASITAPQTANQTLAAVSAIFNWAVREEIVKVNPCAQIERHQTRSRERILADSEIAGFWAAFDNAGLLAGSLLKLILLLGQRPGEVAHMHRGHLIDGWWEMPGEPTPALNWPGTKNGHSHRVWLPQAAQELLADLPEAGSLFIGARGSIIIPAKAMAAACSKLAQATPHDLRRTHGSTITGLGFGRDAMNRIQNHREGGIASVYDRHSYAVENKKIMETVAAHITALIKGGPANVITARFGKSR